MNELDSIFEEMGFLVKGGQLPEAMVYSIARTFSLLARELGEIYKRFGLTPASFNLLMLLKHGKDPQTFTQEEIGNRLVVSPSNMTGLVDRLEKRGLVRRAPGRDRRSKLLQITSKGSGLLDEVWPHHVKEIKRVTQSIKTSDAKRLVLTLRQLRLVLVK